MSMLFDGDLFADYHQLVEDVESSDGIADNYTEAAMKRRVITTPHSLIVLAARNMTVPIRAELHAAARRLRRQSANFRPYSAGSAGDVSCNMTPTRCPWSSLLMYPTGSRLHETFPSGPK